MSEQGEIHFTLTAVLGSAGRFIPSWQAADHVVELDPALGKNTDLLGKRPVSVKRSDLSVMEHEMEAAWRNDSFAALLSWGCAGPRSGLSASLSFLVSIGSFFVDSLSRHPEVETLRSAVAVPLEPEEADRVLAGSPWMVGMEYLSAEWLHIVWDGLGEAFSSEIEAWRGTVSAWFESHAMHRHLAGRVCFHLVESKRGDAPFAFLATYSQESKTRQELPGTNPGICL